MKVKSEILKVNDVALMYVWKAAWPAQTPFSALLETSIQYRFRIYGQGEGGKFVHVVLHISDAA